MKYLLYLILIILPGSFLAQSFSVRDFKSNLALQNVKVENLRNQNIDYSDTDGLINLTDYDSDTLQLSRIGYDDLFLFPSDVKKGAVFFLYPSIINMEVAEVISVFGKEERLREQAHRIEVIPYSEIKFKNPRTAVDVLEQSGMVMIQKSQFGGGSPILRGFEANRVLLVVDGVRMNNAIYRSGHLQNAITIDNNVLKQAEVIFGPSSALYGSDAIGGVIHYRTKDPVLSKTNEQKVKANLVGRLSSAAQERSFHVDATIANMKVGSLTSISHNKFGDVRMGSNRYHGDEDWGIVPTYAVFEEGADLEVENPDKNVQPGTGYDQLDFLQKILFRPVKEFSLTANFQYSTSSLVPRFDNLSDYRDGKLRWAEWNYGPQKRLFFSLQGVVTDSTKFFDRAMITGAVQKIDEDRIRRRFGSQTRLTQSEDVKVYNVNLDLSKALNENIKLHYGIEYVFNDVISSAYTYELGTGDMANADTRYPDGGSQIGMFALYLEHKHKLGKKLNLQAGIRYTQNNLEANFEPNNNYELPFDEISFNRGAVTGSVGLIYKPDTTWQFNILASTGYRNPNIDDVGKVREDDGYVLVPNDEVLPEFAYNGELTVNKYLIERKFQFTGTGFYSILRNAIVPSNYQLYGNDSLMIEGEMARIQTNLNTGQAVVWGYFIGLKAEITKQISAEATYNFTYGQDEKNDLPLAHIPPVFGKASVEYHSKNFRGEVSTLFNGKKSIDRYAPGSSDNLESALEDGTPAWWILNVYGSFFISNTVEAQVGIENILDYHYRPFASGVSAPGRNLILSLRASF